MWTRRCLLISLRSLTSFRRSLEYVKRASGSVDCLMLLVASHETKLPTVSVLGVQLHVSTSDWHISLQGMATVAAENRDATAALRAAAWL